MLKISLLHAPDYMILTPKIETSPYRGRGTPPPPTHTPSPARSPRSFAFVLEIFSVFFWKSEITHSPPPPPGYLILHYKCCKVHFGPDNNKKNLEYANGWVKQCSLAICIEGVIAYKWFVIRSMTSKIISLHFYVMQMRWNQNWCWFVDHSSSY